MEIGEPTPLACCDRECADANRCERTGGVQCKCCGAYFCPVCDAYDERGYCEKCAEEYPREDEEE